MHATGLPPLDYLNKYSRALKGGPTTLMNGTVVPVRTRMKCQLPCDLEVAAQPIQPSSYTVCPFRSSGFLAMSGCHSWEWEVLLASSSQRPGILLTNPQRTGQE